MARRDREPPVLEVRDLCLELAIRGRWVRALDGVSLTIHRGEALGLVGESGSGKSLTALSVPGLLPDNARVVAGSIRVTWYEAGPGPGRGVAPSSRVR